MILLKENGLKNEMEEMREKSCGLSFDSPLLLRKTSLLILTKVACLFFARRSRCFSSRVQVCRSGHAPAHRALSDFEILAFTLHIHH